MVSPSLLWYPPAIGMSPLLLNLRRPSAFRNGSAPLQSLKPSSFCACSFRLSWTLTSWTPKATLRQTKLPVEAMPLYRQRMKVKGGFKGLKNLLGLAKMMNKKQEQMDKGVALALLAYAIGLLSGEETRQKVYRGKRAAMFGPVHPLDTAGGPEQAGHSCLTASGAGSRTEPQEGTI